MAVSLGWGDTRQRVEGHYIFEIVAVEGPDIVEVDARHAFDELLCPCRRVRGWVDAGAERGCANLVDERYRRGVDAPTSSCSLYSRAVA